MKTFIGDCIWNIKSVYVRFKKFAEKIVMLIID